MTPSRVAHPDSGSRAGSGGGHVACARRATLDDVPAPERPRG
ncbi:hypothetical protein ACIP4W_34545 [Streptomyces sp. NPDC088846]